MIKQAITQVVEGKHLSEEEMTLVMNQIMSGDASPAQIGAFITALRMKGETIDEITLLLNAHVTSEVAKFITGARSIDEFDQFVSECEAYGLRELEKIYAKGYENYINAQ